MSNRREMREKRKADALAKQKARQVRLGTEPTATKQPVAVSVESSDDQQLLWSFAYFDHKMDWKDEKEQDEEHTFRELGDHLKAYSLRTWKEIMGDPVRDHPVGFDGLVPEAQKRIRDLNLDRFNEFWRLRFTGRIRIWGIRDREVFRVLWWDPHHQVCPSAKKNT